MTARFWITLGLAAGLAAGPGSACAAGFGGRRYRQSVVKIYAAIQRENYAWPWQPDPPVSGSGSGFLIGRKRILTNAHVVSDARFLEVQREGQSRRYPAEVLFIGHDCDLALLTVSDPDFYARAVPLRLGGGLPDLNEEVIVLGYPMGGDRLSLTRGVVSRLDYQLYTHSQVDSHLALQVDAAINPGNSGGPVLYRGRVVGVAFQGIPNAQNLGYAIPLPVIRHFLDDTADGTYHGYPELGVTHWETPNPALRRRLAIPDDERGVAVAAVDPFGCAAGILEPGDVLLSIDGQPIAHDGTARLDGQALLYVELLERKQAGETVAFQIWRDSRRRAVVVPLVPRPDPFAFRYAYDRRPEYALIGGLVFAPLSRGLLMTLGKQLNQAAARQLVYTATFAKTDGLIEGRDEFVVLQSRLADRVNTHLDRFRFALVDRVNGRPIRRLADLPGAFAAPTGGFHVIRFLNEPLPLVLDAAEAARADPGILERYNVPAPFHLHPAPGVEGAAP